MSEWISVKDKLPERVGDVLVFRDFGGNYGGISILSYRYSEAESKFTFCFYDGESDEYYPTRNVTHWMPLPAKPGEKS